MSATPPDLDGAAARTGGGLVRHGDRPEAGGMQFGGRLSRAMFARMIDERHDQIRRSVGLLPLYGLADWSGPRMIGRWGWSNGVLSSAGLAYGVPSGTGPRAEIVTTAGSAEAEVTDLRTAEALAARPAHDDATFRRVIDAVAAEPVGEVGIEVDGVPKPFRHWRARNLGGGDRSGWHAALAEVPGLVVSASGFEPGQLRLVPITDVEPYLVATREHALATYDAATPSDDAGGDAPRT